MQTSPWLSGLCFSALSKQAKCAHCGFPKGKLFLIPASTHRPHTPSARGVAAVTLGAVTGTRGSRHAWHSRSLPTTSLHVPLAVLKSFFVFVQMLGSLGQRFSICRRLLEQVTLPHIPVSYLTPYRAHSHGEQEIR